MKRALFAVGLLTAALVVPLTQIRAGAIPAGTITPVQTAVPATATAVLTNITMVNGKADGYITADKCSVLQPGAQTRSNGNHGIGQAVANLSVVAVDTDGRFCIDNQSPVDLLADVQGYVAPAAAGGLRYLPMTTAARVLDTRVAPATKPAAATITRIASGAPAGTAAVLANITMSSGAGAGYVTADACSALQPGPQTRSNGNFAIGSPVSNLAVVPVDADGSFCVYNHVPVDLVVDIEGTFTTSSTDGLGFDAATSARVLDTRVAPASTPAAGSITKVITNAPAGTAAVLANITMVDGAAPGYITADRCSALTAGPQSKSNGNHGVAAAVANLTVVPLDPDGSFCIYNQQAVDLAVDVQGVFSATGTQQFFVTPSTRVLDTRPATPPPPVTSCTAVVHIGDSTSVGMISPAVIKDPTNRIDAQYRRVGVVYPNMQISGARSIVETLPGQINAYDTAAAIKNAGYHGCWVFALGTTDTANIAAGSGPGRAVRIDKMMNLVNGDPVMWVNVKSRVASGPWANSNMQLWDNALNQEAPKFPNLKIYDWNSVVQNGWFSGDEVHYTVDGFTIRARLIADALAAAFPG